MNERPVIGLITQLQESLAEPDPQALASDRQYLRAIMTAGGTPLRIPLLHHGEAKLRTMYESLDGLFFTGGADVDPAHYGEERHPKCEPTDPVRDRTELLLCRWARRDNKPILGICRGM